MACRDEVGFKRCLIECADALIDKSPEEVLLGMALAWGACWWDHCK